jgi:hypothetical protein
MGYSLAVASYQDISHKQKKQTNKPYHFRKGMVCQFKMVWYILLLPLRPELEAGHHSAGAILGSIIKTRTIVGF